MVQFFHCKAPNDSEKHGLSRLDNLIGKSSDWLAITNYKPAHRRGREIDVILFAPGALICVEMKSWPGFIAVPDKGPWRVNPAPKNYVEGETNPIDQADTAHWGLHDFLKESSYYSNDWYKSFCVYLSSPDADLSRTYDGDPDISNKLIRDDRLGHDLAIHISRYHPNRINRSKNISSADISGILKYMGIDYESRDRYLSHIVSLYNKGNLSDFGFEVSNQTIDEIRRLKKLREEKKSQTNRPNTQPKYNKSKTGTSAKKPELNEQVRNEQTDVRPSAHVEQIQRQRDEPARRAAEQAQRDRDEAARRAAEQAQRDRDEAARRAIEQAQRDRDEAARRAAEQAQRDRDEAARRATEQAQRDRDEAARRAAEQAQRDRDEAARRATEQALTAARRRAQDILAKRATEKHITSQDKSNNYDMNNNKSGKQKNNDGEYIKKIEKQSLATQGIRKYCPYSLFDGPNKFCAVYSDNSAKIRNGEKIGLFINVLQEKDESFFFSGQEFKLNLIHDFVKQYDNLKKDIVGTHQTTIYEGYQPYVAIYTMYTDNTIKCEYDNSTFYFKDLDTFKWFHSNISTWNRHG